jgi:hypothetical protein
MQTTKTSSRQKQQATQIFLLLNALHTACIKHKIVLDSVKWSQLISLIPNDANYPFEICESNLNYTRLRQFYMNHFKTNNGKRNKVLANFVSKFIMLVKKHKSQVISEQIVIKLAKSCKIREMVYETFAKSAWCCHLPAIALPYDLSYSKMSTSSVQILDFTYEFLYHEIIQDECISDNQVHDIWV